MQIGMVGLGRMGANMVRRLMRGGHTAAVFDLGADRVRELECEGAVPAVAIEELVRVLAPPRTVWLMVPAGAPTEQMVSTIANQLSPDDVIIDGGNSHFKDDVRRAGALKAKKIHYLDVGTSGGCSLRIRAIRRSWRILAGSVIK